MPTPQICPSPCMPARRHTDPAAALDAAAVGEIIHMALSDDVGFEQILAAYGLGPDRVKALMRAQLAPGSYRAWRKRVRRFSDQRAVYK